MSIEEKIKAKLDEIAEKEKIKILYCAESGSRAWGFASPDSDYDVRFIYVRRKEDYLRLDPVRDVIEWQLDDIYDISGWDIQKMLRLLKKSNPTIFEWNNSPIIYKTSEEWGGIVKSVIEEYFDPKAAIYHYMSMANINHRKHLPAGKIKLKKYFYVLRPLLCAKWVAEKGSPPPMLFEELLAAEADKEIIPEAEKLLAMKKVASEMGESEHIAPIDDYIASLTEWLEAASREITPKKTEGWDRLNGVFLSLIV